MSYVGVYEQHHWLIEAKENFNCFKKNLLNISSNPVSIAYKEVQDVLIGCKKRWSEKWKDQNEDEEWIMSENAEQWSWANESISSVEDSNFPNQVDVKFFSDVNKGK